MYNDNYFREDDIYGLATPFQSSAIAVYRVSGKNSITLLSKIFSNPKKLLNAKSATIVHGYIQNLKKELIDEVLVSVFLEPHGYTGENSAEISLHGSIASIKAVGIALAEVGFKIALRGEFTFRAVKNGKLSVNEAESVLSMVDSKTEKTRSLALKGIMGALNEKILSLREELLELLSIFELQLDYSDMEFDENLDYPFDRVKCIKDKIKNLLSYYTSSKILNKGIDIVLVGRTNAGKSTLFNCLLNTDRSIVSAKEGTTRDYLKESIELGGYFINLYDTAGFNENSVDLIEEEGIRRSKELLNQADIVINLCSAQDSDNLKEFIENKKRQEKEIIVLSQISKAHKNKKLITQFKTKFKPVEISCLEGIGIKNLTDSIIKKIDKLNNINDDTKMVLISEYDKNKLQKAFEHIKKLNENLEVEEASSEVSSAIFEIDHLLGINTSPNEILDKVFKNFCVGK